MSPDFNQFLLGAGLNLVSALIIVRGVYYPWTQNRSYVFTFLAFNTAIYFVMDLLPSIELSVGAGFGLFAIFSVIRYRTEEMPIREMTYLFVIIALPVMNSVLGDGGEVEKVLVANGTIMVLLYILEREWGFHFEVHKRVTYEKIDLIKPERREELLADLKARTGLEVTRVDIGRIDFLRDVAELTVYYDLPRVPKAQKRRQGLATEYNPVVPQHAES
ncbi:MAG: DUF4956 domain-containing protein [Dehalococcoidia bacterium]|nr:DUF4956 domain-containing protein [Dehalococcoidia bacterium]